MWTPMVQLEEGCASRGRVKDWGNVTKIFLSKEKDEARKKNGRSKEKGKKIGERKGGS